MKKIINYIFIVTVMILLMAPVNKKVYAATPEEMILSQINAERTKAGLGGLVFDNALCSAAKVRALEASSVFSHVRPNGQDYYTVDPTHVYGENLSKVVSNDFESVVTAFMLSPAHKANVLYKGSTAVGIAVYTDANGTAYVAVEFN